jgi:hypothetical protein
VICSGSLGAFNDLLRTRNIPHIVAKQAAARAPPQGYSSTARRFAAGSVSAEARGHRATCFLLMSNSSRGVMKIPTADFGTAIAITGKVTTETVRTPL